MQDPQGHGFGAPLREHDEALEELGDVGEEDGTVDGVRPGFDRGEVERLSVGVLERGRGGLDQWISAGTEARYMGYIVTWVTWGLEWSRRRVALARQGV